MAQQDIIKERRQKISDHIETHGRADTNTLAVVTESTAATIRRDLAYLEQKGLIIRTHGGAVKSERKKSVWQTSTISSRLEKNYEIKRNIAAFAATLIKDNESVMIDGGSTTQIFAGYLKEHHNLLVVTNSPGITESLIHNETARIIQIGGELIRDTYQVAGPDAEAHLRRFQVDKSIVSVSGADPNNGCYTAIPIEASLKRTMIEHAHESILLVDSSKFDRRALCFAFPFEAIDIVITDSNISKQTAEQIRKLGVTLHIVDV